MMNRYDQVYHYCITMETEQPLHVGSWDGNQEQCLLHPGSKKPFIQAYSIAGALRSYCQRLSMEDSEILFGKNKSAEGDDIPSRIKVTDAVIEGNADQIKMELRPHVRINGKFGSVNTEETHGILSGTKFQILYLSTGTKFQFDLYYYTDADNRKIDSELEYIKECIQAIHTGDILFGSRKSTGCGKCKIIKCDRMFYDLMNLNSRTSWLNAEKSPVCIDLLPTIEQTLQESYHLQLKGKIAASLLTKGVGILKADNNYEEGLQARSLKNASKEYIIPGSSVKGVVRNQVAKILDFRGKEGELLNQIFGGESNHKEGNMAPGILFFEDCILKDHQDDMQPRIHIDKFTGGVMDGQLFHEEVVNGGLELNINVKGMDQNLAKRAAGLLLMVLRDISLGLVSLGGGSNIGRGYLEVSEITLQHQSEIETILVENRKLKLPDKKKLIVDCMEALGGK